MVKVLHIEEIVSDPALRNGRPVINGTTLCVSDVVLAHTTGDRLSPSNYGTPAACNGEQRT